VLCAATGEKQYDLLHSVCMLRSVVYVTHLEAIEELLIAESTALVFIKSHHDTRDLKVCEGTAEQLVHCFHTNAVETIMFACKYTSV
jgi:hypothetical protein